jgi:glyoxylase-like metal-dependent hydrolase (beta-lactamase superfamily II)
MSFSDRFLPVALPRGAGRALALGVLLLWLPGLGFTAQAVPARPSACARLAPVDWRAVAPGVWVWLPERLAELSPANQGRILPISAVVDGGQALVIDPGPSHRQGLRVRQSLACRFGAQVHWVVNTHAHAESVLGNSAFADLQARGLLDIAASAGTLEAMKKRCEQCLRSLTKLVGARAMANSRIVLPNRVLGAGDTLRVGRFALQVMQAENAHTESDLWLWAPGQRVLWAGGLLYDGRIPELAQGSLNGWLDALPRLAALRPAAVVGASVSVAPDDASLPEIFAATEGYLQALRGGVLQAMDAGLDGSDVQSVQLPGYAHWVGYRERHGFNVQRAWRELEPEWMETARPAMSSAIPASPASASVPDIGR